MISRSKEVGWDHLLIVGGYLEESNTAYNLACKSDKFWSTVGVHPCRVDDVDKNGGK